MQAPNTSSRRKKRFLTSCVDRLSDDLQMLMDLILPQNATQQARINLPWLRLLDLQSSFASKFLTFPSTKKIWNLLPIQ